MSRALEPVIARHIEEHSPVLLRDFIAPSLATLEAHDGVRASGRVRALFVYEPDVEQIARASTRENEEGLRHAEIAWRYGQWLREECRRVRLPVIPARPWETGVERAITALEKFSSEL